MASKSKWKLSKHGTERGLTQQFLDYHIEQNDVLIMNDLHSRNLIELIPDEPEMPEFFIDSSEAFEDYGGHILKSGLIRKEQEATALKVLVEASLAVTSFYYKDFMSEVGGLGYSDESVKAFDAYTAYLKAKGE